MPNTLWLALTLTGATEYAANPPRLNNTFLRVGHTIDTIPPLITFHTKVVECIFNTVLNQVLSL
nr:Putative uncharacterized protein [Moritella viscosa]SHO18490.1 Putative uncharacterized protein [Moritella viscosa]